MVICEDEKELSDIFNSSDVDIVISAYQVLLELSRLSMQLNQAKRSFLLIKKVLWQADHC